MRRGLSVPVRGGRGKPFDPASLVDGTLGFWLRARDHALGQITVPAPWVPHSGRAESWTSLQSPPGTDFTQYRPTVADVGPYRRVNFDVSAPFATRTQHLTANVQTAKAAWKFPHLAAGCSIAAVVDFGATNSNVQPYFQTGYSQAETGLSFHVNSGRVNVQVGNGSGTFVVQTLTEAVPAATVMWVEFFWSQLAGYCLRVNGGPLDPGAQSFTGTIFGTPSTGNPTYNPCIGGPFADPFPAQILTFYLGGDVRDLLIVPGVFSGADWVRMRKYFAALYPDVPINVDGGILPTVPFVEDGSDPRILLP